MDYNILRLLMSAKRSSSGMNYFSEDSAGFRIQPKTVLIMSLVYIGIVVLLHIYSKLGSPSKEEQPKAPSTDPKAEPNDQ